MYYYCVVNLASVLSAVPHTDRSSTVNVRFYDSLPVVEVQLEVAVVDIVGRGKQQAVVVSGLEAHRDVIGVCYHRRVNVDASARPAVVRQYRRHCVKRSTLYCSHSSDTSRGGSKRGSGGRAPYEKSGLPCGPPMAPSKVTMTQAYC